MDVGQLHTALQGAVDPRIALELLTPLTTALVLIPAAMIDYKEHRIPNVLSLVGWLMGPILYTVFLGLDGLRESLTGLAILLLLGFPLWLIHWMGAGDVKLMAGVGALVGAGKAPQVFLGIVITGLLLGVALLLRKRQFRLRMRRVLAAIGLTFLMKEVFSPIDNSQKPIVMPYGIPIAFGTLLTELYIMV